MRIYLDNCCFNRPFYDQSQIRIRLESEAKLKIQDDILEGKLKLVWSYILDAENERILSKRGKSQFRIGNNICCHQYKGRYSKFWMRRKD